MVLKNRVIRLKFLVLGCYLLFSCTKQASKLNDDQVFRYNEHTNISSLDPAFAKNQANIWAVNQLFNGLVQLDDNLKIQPDIAKKWTISADGKTYEFSIRNDVKFHKHSLFGSDSTRIVKAQDFVYSFNRLLDGKIASSGRWVLQNVESFKAKNDTLFSIKLNKPFPPFLGLLSMKYCSVVPKEIVNYYGTDFRSNPVGTGPFKFKLWVENEKLVFRKNNHYYEIENNKKLPHIEAVAITFLPDKQSEFLQFIQGNLDFLNSIDPSYKDDILTSQGMLSPRYSDKIKIKTGAYLNTEYLGILMDANISETDSELIRKAVNYGFDRVKMITYLRNGIGTPAENGFIPKGLPSFNSLKGYSYQPEKAAKLINEYKDISGNENPTITISTNSQYVDLCEYIQRELQNVGLVVNIDVMPPSTLRQSKANGKLSVFRASWIADYPDAENYLSLFYSKNFAPNGPNYMHFSDEQFDKWYEASIRTTKNELRYKLYQKMDSLLMVKAPVVPLYYDQVVRFSQKNISGLGINPINLLNLKRVQKN